MASLTEHISSTSAEQHNLRYPLTMMDSLVDRSRVRRHSGTSELCHFFKLPIELRNGVYSIVLDSAKYHLCLTVDLAAVQRPSTHGTRVLYTNVDFPHTLAFTSRQIKHEMYSLLYGSREFTILSAPFPAITRMEPNWFQYVRNISADLYICDLKYPGSDLWSTDSSHSKHVHVDVHLTKAGKLEMVPETRHKYGFVDADPNYCTCMLAQRAQDVNQGFVGSSHDPPIMRLLKTLLSSQEDALTSDGTCFRKVYDLCLD